MTIEEQRAGIHQVYQQRFNEVEDSAYVDLRKAYNVAIDKSKTSLGDIKQFWQYNVCNGAGYGQPCAYRAPGFCVEQDGICGKCWMERRFMGEFQSDGPCPEIEKDIKEYQSWCQDGQVVNPNRSVEAIRALGDWDTVLAKMSDRDIIDMLTTP